MRISNKIITYCDCRHVFFHFAINFIINYASGNCKSISLFSYTFPLSLIILNYDLNYSYPADLFVSMSLNILFLDKLLYCNVQTVIRVLMIG